MYLLKNNPHHGPYGRYVIFTILDNYLNKPISKFVTISMISAVDMTVKGGRIILRQYAYLVYSAVDAVAHRNINKPVASSNRDLYHN